MSKRNAVSFKKPADPKFLKTIKEAVGFKDDDLIEAKRQKLNAPADEDNGDEVREDEKPAVVVDEVQSELSQKDIEDALSDHRRGSEPSCDGRIMFRKPKKTSTDDGSEPKVKKFQSAKVKNRSLLSFDDED